MSIKPAIVVFFIRLPSFQIRTLLRSELSSVRYRKSQAVMTQKNAPRERGINDLPASLKGISGDGHPVRAHDRDRVLLPWAHEPQPL